MCASHLRAEERRSYKLGDGETNYFSCDKQNSGKFLPVCDSKHDKKKDEESWFHIQQLELRNYAAIDTHNHRKDYVRTGVNKNQYYWL